MGQGLSCGESQEHELFIAVQKGEMETLEAMADEDRSLLALKSVNKRLSALHVAAANGRFQVLSMLLDRIGNPDILDRHKQTPLMLAAMHGKISCAERLIQAGANLLSLYLIFYSNIILTFDTLHGRTCLHYAAYNGYSDCLQLILSAARSAPVAHSWGFTRFVNIRDGSGSTPLHLAARQGQADCVRILLSSGALVSATACGVGYSHPGSTPLHLAARNGSLDCVRELLAWGADRLLRDSSGRIPYMVATKYKHEACAALLNPSAPEPLTWPSRLKFINELNSEAKALLEKALIMANKEREKAILKETSNTLLPPSNFSCMDDDIEACDVELCCICFERVSTIEVQKCGHEMCAHCILALCCYNKPNLGINCSKVPVCPFCRIPITQLAVAKSKTNSEVELESIPMKPKSTRKSLNLDEGSSFKSLSPLTSLGRLGRGLGRVAAECNEGFDKQEVLV